MADFKAAKVVAALPATLEADTVYFIRAGSGFDIKVTNGAGTIVAYPLNLENKQDKLENGVNIKSINGATLLGTGDIEISGSLTAEQLLKFATIHEGATRNSTDSELLNRINHTGTQPIYTITGLSDHLDQKVDKQQGRQLTDINFTKEKDDKLSSLESSKFKGQYSSLVDLQNSYPNPDVGSYANIDEGASLGVSRYFWDGTLSLWKKQVGASAEMTAAQIKQEYESNPDTNVFTDDEKMKLTLLGSFSQSNNLVFRVKENSFKSNIDGNIVEVKDINPKQGDVILFGEPTKPDLLVLKEINSSGTGSWKIEPTDESDENKKDIFNDGSAVVLYNFDGDVKDKDNRFNATTSGNVTYEEGRFGQAVNTSNGYVALSMDILGRTSDILKSYTYSAWYKSKDTTDTGEIPLVGLGGMSNTLSLGVINKRAVFVTNKNNNLKKAVGTSDVQDGQWHHILGIYNKRDDLLQVYVDGVLEDSISIAGYVAHSGAAGYFIGSINGQVGIAGRDGSATTNGLIDQVRIFDKVVNIAEIYHLLHEAPLQVTIEHNLNKLQDQVYFNPIQTMNMQLPVAANNNAAIELGLIKNDMYLLPNNHVMLVT